MMRIQIKQLLMQAGGDIGQIRENVETSVMKLPQVAGASVQSLMSQEFTSVVMSAENLAQKANDKFVTIERLLQALVTTSGNEAYDILKKYLYIYVKIE